MSGRLRRAMIVSALALSLLSLVFVVREASPYAADTAASRASGLSLAGLQDDMGDIVNPHSDLVFKATGTTSCRDCHAVTRSTGRLAVLDNAAVRGLIAKGKGAHGPGRFADCFRCHSGGRKGVERYSDG